MEIKGKKEYLHIILKYNEKTKMYDDITKQVIYAKKLDNSWYVVFDNKQAYHFKLDNILVSDEKEDISLKDKTVYINNKKTFAYGLVYFKNIGYKLFLPNLQTMFIKQIEIKGNDIYINNLHIYMFHTKNKIFNYYKSLACYAKDLKDSEEDNVEKHIFNLYNSIDSINLDSALYSYTKQSFKQNKIDISNYIFPFSTNASQIEAIKTVFENNVSIISGPPGTGKTQVILNLIANSLLQNKKIAVISNNNTAVENVYSKLKELNYDFFLASLGNSMNVESFFEKEDKLREKLEKITFNNTISRSNSIKTLIELYNKKNELQILKDELYKLEIEYDHFKKRNSNRELIEYGVKVQESEDYLKLKNYLECSKQINIFNRLKIYFKYKVKVMNIDNVNNFIYYLDNKYYESTIQYIKTKIDEINDLLAKNNIYDLEKELKKSSKNFFNMFLYKKYINKTYPKFTKENYKILFDEFLDRYPVTLSTTHSLLRNCKPGFIYDLIIVDEASQSDILTTLLTMNITKNIVVIGDTKQLSQIDNQDIYDVSDKLANIYQIDEEYRYKDNSILKSMSSLKTKPKEAFLREHYRCDLRIIKFCNEKFYSNQLIICTETSENDPLEVVYTVEGNHARKNPNGTGQYNARECDEIINILKNNDTDSVGIITPFKAQANYILSQIKDDFPNVEVDTIHKYQGRQKDIIILSTVVNDLKEDDSDFITNFVTNPQLLNVAVSRAVKKIYLVVSEKVYKSSNNTISQLIEYIKYYCNDNVKQGDVVSVFDVLYNNTYKTLQTQKINSIYDSVAEKIMKKELEKILQEYKEYSLAMHVRLKDLITTYDGFNEEEVKYINHPKTHVDFVIFDKITYKPKLCIEVDGTKYHDYSNKQIVHDEIKDRILKTNNINILRLKTNKSKEIVKIKELL